MNCKQRALLTLCGVTIALLAGLMLATQGLAPRVARAQTEPAITAPAPGSTVTGLVTVTGTAIDPTFQRYELYFKPAEAGEQAYAYIGEGMQEVTAGPLAVWDTTELPPGAYDLRMRVVRLDGNYSEYFVENVQVAPEPGAPTPTPTVEPTAAPTETATVTVTATLTPTVAPTVEPSPPPVEEAEVVTEEVAELPADEAQILSERSINVRGGPGTNYPIVGALQPGERALITGQNEAGDWWQIQLDGDSGWVLGQLVTAENVTDVPVVEAPAPPPTPEPEAETPTEPVAEATETEEPVEEAAEGEAVTEVGEVVAVEEVAVPAPQAARGAITVTLAGADDNADALRAFVRMLLVGFSPSNTVITATIGALPADLPIDLTVPPTATVIGGVVRTGEFEGGQVFLSTQETADELLTALREQLLEQGFTVPAQERVQGGPSQVFLSSQDLAASLFLCGPDDEVAINLGAATVTGEAETVSLSINPTSGFGGPCAEEPARGDADPFDVLPQLAPPAETQVRGSGGGSSSGPDSITVSAEAEIETDLSTVELATHYEDQLADAGWERLDDSQTEALAWSAWSFTDEEGNDWNATFYIVRQAGEAGGYVATLRAESQQ